MRAALDGTPEQSHTRPQERGRWTVLHPRQHPLEFLYRRGEIRVCVTHHLRAASQRDSEPLPDCLGLPRIAIEAVDDRPRIRADTDRLEELGRTVGRPVIHKHQRQLRTDRHKSKELLAEKAFLLIEAGNDQERHGGAAYRRTATGTASGDPQRRGMSP